MRISLSGYGSFSVVFLGLPGRRLGCSVSACSDFFGRPGLRRGFAGCPVVTRIFGGSSVALFTFRGLPGFRFTGSVGAVERLDEAVVAIGLVELVLVCELIGPELVNALASFTYLGRPGLRFIGTGSSSTFGSAFGLPLFTSVKSGLTR